ncbi:hypothetical protein H4Q26_010112 [Puccinia striiformis f. sp. tritici PST-130]|nr:hypothetical protein H4Q26_010112 [Puccinia striiformis f. sp. tritici PST-130]
MKFTILCFAAILIQGAHCESEAPFVCKKNPAKPNHGAPTITKASLAAPLPITS